MWARRCVHRLWNHQDITVCWFTRQGSGWWLSMDPTWLWLSLSCKSKLKGCTAISIHTSKRYSVWSESLRCVWCQKFSLWKNTTRNPPPLPTHAHENIKFCDFSSESPGKTQQTAFSAARAPLNHKDDLFRKYWQMSLNTIILHQFPFCGDKDFTSHYKCKR